MGAQSVRNALQKCLCFGLFSGARWRCFPASWGRGLGKRREKCGTFSVFRGGICGFCRRIFRFCRGFPAFALRCTPKCIIIHIADLGISVSEGRENCCAAGRFSAVWWRFRMGCPGVFGCIGGGERRPPGDCWRRLGALLMKPPPSDVQEWVKAGENIGRCNAEPCQNLMCFKKNSRNFTVFFSQKYQIPNGKYGGDKAMV